MPTLISCFQVRHHALIDFQLERLENLERIQGWSACSISLEG